MMRDPSSLRMTGQSRKRRPGGEGEAGRPACDRRMLVVVAPCCTCNSHAARGEVQKSGKEGGPPLQNGPGQFRAILQEIQWIWRRTHISLSGAALAVRLKWRAVVVGGNNGIGELRRGTIGGDWSTVDRGRVDVVRQGAAEASAEPSLQSAEQNSAAGGPGRAGR
jgi:hypothetical protein